jgi:hypothetical protein
MSETVGRSRGTDPDHGRRLERGGRRVRRRGPAHHLHRRAARFGTTAALARRGGTTSARSAAHYGLP